MEEEKAAAYYNELLGKGRNAALFKQGLGFGSNTANAPPAKSGMINFVGAGKSTEADKELDQPLPSSKSADIADAPAAKYGMINFVGAGKATEARKEPWPLSKPSDRDGDGQAPTSLSKKVLDVRSGSRSLSEEKDQRERSDNKDRCRSPSKESRGRRRSKSGEPRRRSPRNERRRSRSRSKERSRRDCSGSRSRRSRRSESRELSRSPLRKRSRYDRHRRSRSRDRGRRHFRDRNSRSRSRSRDRSQRYHRDQRSRSRSRSRDRSQRYHRDQRSRSRSRSKESDRQRRNVSRSRSRERRRLDYKTGRGRSKSGSPGRRGRDQGLDDDRKNRGRSDHRQDTGRLSPSRRPKRTARRLERDQDWAKLIPGFDSMTPAERVKAKMKLQLSQTVVKDAGKGVEEEWERFDFNKDAPLDGDAKQDYFGDGTGASTDTADIDKLGGSHLLMTEQARKEARLQAAHEAAIFGTPVVLEGTDAKGRPSRRERESSDSFGGDDDGDENDNGTGAAKVSGVVSEQIIALQAGSSWQERIKKMRSAQAQHKS